MRPTLGRRAAGRGPPVASAVASHMTGGGSVPTQHEKAEQFRALHEGEPFVIPNPWDAGSARALAALGFRALASTSSGFAFTLGRRDGGATLDEVAEHAGALDRATALPVSVDLENGYGPDPRTPPARSRASPRPAPSAARSRTTTRTAASTTLDHAVERIAAAREAARGARLPVHAHRARREPHPGQPRSRRHDRAPAGLRGARAPTSSTRRACAPPRRSAPSATPSSKPVNVLALPGLTLRRDRRRRRAARQRRRRADLGRGRRHGRRRRADPRRRRLLRAGGARPARRLAGRLTAHARMQDV